MIGAPLTQERFLTRAGAWALVAIALPALLMLLWRAGAAVFASRHDGLLHVFAALLLLRLALACALAPLCVSRLHDIGAPPALGLAPPAMYAGEWTMTCLAGLVALAITPSGAGPRAMMRRPSWLERLATALALVGAGLATLAFCAALLALLGAPIRAVIPAALFPAAVWQSGAPWAARVDALIAAAPLAVATAALAAAAQARRRAAAQFRNEERGDATA